MRFAGLTAALAALLVLEAQPAPADGQQQQRSHGVEEKLQQLAKLTKKKSIVRLNLSKFKDLVLSSPRDYSFIVLFTATAPERQCDICQELFEHYEVVADSFRYSPAHNNDKLFFGLVDYEESSAIFQMLRLNNAPVIIHFPAKGKPKPADSMDLERAGFDAEAIAKFIQDHTDMQVSIFLPPDYSGAIAILTLTMLIGGFLYMRRNNLQFLQNKQMWAVTAVLFCFAMISGMMWNQMQEPPFFHRGKNGNKYISGSSNDQFVVESYIVMALNGAVIVGMILMIEAAGGVKPASSTATAASSAAKGKRRHFQSLVGLVLVCVFFSVLLSVFKAKTQGYPYSFLLD